MYRSQFFYTHVLCEADSKGMNKQYSRNGFFMMDALVSLGIIVFLAQVFVGLMTLMLEQQQLVQQQIRVIACTSNVAELAYMGMPLLGQHTMYGCLVQVTRKVSAQVVCDSALRVLYQYHIIGSSLQRPAQKFELVIYVRSTGG
jgi:hypothetical protein